MNPRTQVMCVDDCSDIADLYSSMVGMQDDMQCVGTLNTADDLIDEARKQLPDVILLDLSMPGKDSMTALAEMTQYMPDVRVIVFSGHDDHDVAERALRAGAWGLISKRDEPELVLDGIRRVARGEMFFPQMRAAG